MKTGFDVHVDGFAFVNSWEFEPVERERLRELFAGALRWSTILGAATFGLAGALLVPIGIRALRKRIEEELSKGYGLCGGMCFAALDAYLSGVHLPRGEHRNDHPAGGSPLRAYLWKRQIKSLVHDLSRFQAWLILLNHIPAAWPFSGGKERLVAMTRVEWAKARARLDARSPVPLGLVRDTNYVFENHQVLAIGYELDDADNGTITLYDPNCPDVESTLRFDLGDSATLEEGCRAAVPLRGFFCETYSHVDPREALG